MTTIIIIERKGKKQFSKFIDLFKKRSEISVKEITSKIPKSTFYDFILEKLYTVNQSIKNIYPNLSFIIPISQQDKNGKVIRYFKRNPNIKIDQDRNFFYLNINLIKKYNRTKLILVEQIIFLALCVIVGLVLNVDILILILIGALRSLTLIYFKNLETRTCQEQEQN